MPLEYTSYEIDKAVDMLEECIDALNEVNHSIQCIFASINATMPINDGHSTHIDPVLISSLNRSMSVICLIANTVDRFIHSSLGQAIFKLKYDNNEIVLDLHSITALISQLMNLSHDKSMIDSVIGIIKLKINHAIDRIQLLCNALEKARHALKRDSAPFKTPLVAASAASITSSFPFDNFRFMHTLSKNSDTVELQQLKHALKGFTLFAFVIYDPMTHHRFHQVMNDHLAELDHSTGKRLLFFSFINDDHNIVHKLRRRPYYQRMREFQQGAIAKELIESQDRPKIPNTAGIDHLTLALSLGIPQESLPVIVITEGIGGMKGNEGWRDHEDAVWIRTCEQHVKDQLNTIGYWATEYRSHAITHVRTNLREIDWCDGFGELDLINSLSSTLADVLAFVSLERGSPSDQRTQAHDAIQRLYRQIDQMRHDQRTTHAADRPMMTPDLERLYMTIGGMLALRQMSQSPRGREWHERWSGMPSSCHPGSLAFLQTAILAEEAIRGATCSKSEQDALLAGIPLDYSPAIINYAKVLEHEVNRSLIQWAREQRGIEMPRYYYEIARPHDERYHVVPIGVDNPQPISLNLGRKHKGQSSSTWQPLTLGQAWLACDTLVSDGARIPGVPIDQWRALQQPWRALNELRNRAAHAGLLDEATARQAAGHVRTIADSGMFTQMARLRARASGQHPPAISSVTPMAAPIGAELTITGANLYPRETVVTFAGQRSATLVSHLGKDSLVVRVPARAQHGPITVTTPGGVVQSSAFAVVQHADRTGATYAWVPPGAGLPGFWMMHVPVTNDQWRMAVIAGVVSAPQRLEAYGNPAKAQHPVVCVTREQAHAYATWVGGRLPRDAEWTRAARGDDGGTYPWGDELPNETLANFGRPRSDGGDTSPVGSYPAGASPYGLLDMAGNVWEWVDPDDPREQMARYIVRGGAFRSNWIHVACTARSDGEQGSSVIGLRVAADVEMSGDT